MTPLHRVTIASRVFGMAAILGLGIVSGDLQVIFTLLIVATLATTAVYVSLITPLATAVVVTVEAGITALVIGLALPNGVVFLPYLVVLTLIAGITRGVVGVSAVFVVQFFSIALAISAWTSGDNHQEEVFRLLSPWLLTSIGMGLLGVWLRRLGVVPQRSAGDPSYELAHRLLIQLRTVSRRLASGLDPVTIATHLQAELSGSLRALYSGIYVRTEGGLLTPLVISDGVAAADLSPRHPIVQDCWTEMEPTVAVHADPRQSHLAALPLRVGPRMIGVALARLRCAPDRACLSQLMVQLDEHSLRLETALTFDEIRFSATAEERRRLAREIHDGVAQEITSIGYAVDGLVSVAESEEQRADLLLLREDLTRVVRELRLSVFELRSEVVPEAGLGSALSEYVRRVGGRSTMTVHLSIRESPNRLRPETETELLRIAQEAIANAHKHSQGDNLWITCNVDPPFARLVVRDDGCGLQSAGADSFGLRIMKERAQRIDARLEVESAIDRPGGSSGTLITVTLGDPPQSLRQGGTKHVDVHLGDEDRLTRR